MQNIKRVIALLLCAAMLLGLMGCQEQTDATEPTTQTTEAPTETTEPPVTEPQELISYREAVAAIEAAPSLSMRISSTKTIRIAEETISEKSSQTLKCTGLDTESPRYQSEETVSHLSVYSTSYDEIYSDGTVYLTVDDTNLFSGTCTAEEYAQRYLPAVLLDPELYGDIAVDGSTLTFSQPTAAETWALPEGAEMTEASGSARFNKGGDLQKTTYTITYTYGSAEITLEAEVSVTIEDVTVEVPTDVEAYVPLTCLDAPRMMETSVGNLFQTVTYTSNQLESLYCQAAGLMRNQSYSVNTYFKGNEFVSKSETGVYARDYANYETFEYDLEETFIDGAFSYTEDDGDPVAVPGVTPMYLRSIYESERAENILLLDCWQDAAVTDLGTLYLIELTLNEDWGIHMQGKVSEFLWEDENFLMDLSSGYTNTELTSYVGIDKYTGLPTSSGFYFEGTHTIDGYDYMMMWQLDQAFESPSLGAYEEITEEKLPEEEPEVTPTPLFYHVTGPDGQEMWLFGTIHVGDNRTAYLPQEIYDALSASDALAVECDTEGFDEQYEEDEDLQDQVSDAYYYSDGTTIQDRIDPELYEIAKKYMKATGNYNMNSEYLKTFFWYNSIDNFYLQQGYQLTSEQGVEERLTKFAEDNEIPLWEVESSMFQINMMGSFSAELTEWMLEGAVEYADPRAWEGSMELFELWCAGDEEALRERISCEVDLTDATEEDLADYEAHKHLLEEYNEAMSHSRNDGMLEVLKGYLESGNTVFVAVGLAHLLDETNGLVDTLRAAGYTVELVTYAG